MNRNLKLLYIHLNITTMEKKFTRTDEMRPLVHEQKRRSWFINSTWIMLLLMSVLLWNCEKDTFEGETVGECPEVIFTDPANSATNVVTNKVITATFNKEVVLASVNAQTYTIKLGTVMIPGVVTYADKIATFTPTKPLEANKTYTGLMSKKVKDPDGNFPIEDYTWSFTTGNAPVVTVTDPVNATSNVTLNKVVTVTFSTDMNAATINTSTFLVNQGTSPVSGTVSYSGKTATFTPTNLLADNTVYSGTITIGAKDVAGNALENPYTWSFSTAQTSYIVTLSSNPVEGGSTSGGGLFNDDDEVTVVATSITGYSFSSWTEGSNIVSTNSNYTFAVTSNRELVANFTIDTYSLIVTSSNGSVTWIPNQTTFNAGTTVLLTASAIPGYIFTGWGGDATGTANPLTVTMNSNKNITANFTAIPPDTYTLDVTAINGSVSKNPNSPTYNAGATVLLTATPNTGYTFTSWSGDATGSNNPLTVIMNEDKVIVANFSIITFTLTVISVNGTVLKNPEQIEYNFGENVELTATANSGFTFDSWSGDATGSTNPITVLMDDDKIITANYVVSPPSGPEGIDLGSAGDFAILAGSGISNTGVTTIINGDVGSFPTATINGLLAGNVNGTLYTVADPIVGQAKEDLTTAFNDAQSRSLDAISLPGNLGGLTLAPGLYVNSTTSGITGTGPLAILTLDAGGNPDAVWIFKMGSTFITDPSTAIVLAGNAQAKNIYWSVGTSATLGTNSVFYGNILADQAITLTTGATLYGRALTRVAAVTLDSNTVTKP